MDDSTMDEFRLWEVFDERWRAQPEVANGPLSVREMVLDQEPPRVVLGSAVSEGRVTAALGRDMSSVVFTSVVSGRSISLRTAARVLGIHAVEMDRARAAVLDGLEQSERVAGRTPADRAPLPSLGGREVPFVRDSEGWVMPEESAAVMFEEEWEKSRIEGFEVRWLGMNAGATGADVQIIKAGSWVTASYDSERLPEMTVKGPRGSYVDVAAAAELLRCPERAIQRVVDAVDDAFGMAWMEHGAALYRREVEDAHHLALEAGRDPWSVRERNHARIEGGTRCGIQRDDSIGESPSTTRKPSR